MGKGRKSGAGSGEGIERMATLIPIFNLVHDLLEKTKGGKESGHEIQFPQIAVVGSQSAGKSSVLESLVGLPFLPRGTGIVTRCPIELRLIHTPGTNIWFEFEHRRNKRFHDPKEVEKEIVDRTERIAGINLGISKESIKITVYSPNVLNLTVVDLPGLVQIPVGDQPPDISVQIKDLVKSYISQETSIILAVSPGNVDIATSESINFAKEADPEQKRTIVVLTKLDLADDKERMTEILKGNVVSIKLGIVGVINRSQEENDSNKPWSDVLQYENAFLQNNYPTIAHQNGIGYLAKRLNRILQKHIAVHCRGLISTVRHLASVSEAELLSLGNNEELTDDEKRQVMISIIDAFAKVYKTQIDGQQRSEITSSSLTRGTGLNFIIQDRLDAELNSVKPFDEMTDEDILIAIRNAMPVGARMINPEVVLDHFLQEEIKRISPLSTHIANLSYQTLIEMIDNCLAENSRFPKINAAISSVVIELLTARMKITKEIMSNYFEVQSSSAMTADRLYTELFKKSMSPISVVDVGILPNSFVSQPPLGNEKLCILSNSSTFTPEGPDSFSEQQLTLCTVMRELAGKIFEIVRWQAQDFITKAILSALVYKTVDNVSKTLIMELNTFEKIENLVREPEDIHAHRIFLRKKIQEYNEALKLMEDLMNEAA